MHVVCIRAICFYDHGIRKDSYAGDKPMSIAYFEDIRTFKLDTPNSTYMIRIVDDDNFIVHLYYGRKLTDVRTDDLARLNENPFVPSKNNRDRCSFLDAAPFEYPAHGLGDYRDDAFGIRTEGGYSAVSLSYVSHKIMEGKPPIPGLPATFGAPDSCTTLIITALDRIAGVEVQLYYTVFADNDAIARSVRVYNKSASAVTLTKVLSACLEVDGADYDTIMLPGSWSRERMIDRRPLGYGKTGMSSLRGETGHQVHPFIALLDREATEDTGEVYGMNFVYSGNFTLQAELSQFDRVRLLMGINPEDFAWKLMPGEEFCAPEVILVYSAEGIGGMSRTYHDLYRGHLIRSPYKDKQRPILINNWEATYFNFDTDKLISIAKQAHELGIEMLVMDDGWFGKRDDDNSSLGDWIVNENKLRGGLKYLVDEVNKLGMKFGIWFEPEMVSPDSDLYRAHPDWAIQIPGRVGSRARNQYVLDLSRQEVVDYTFGQVSRILKSANIEYVKWDMNRQISDLGSFGLPADRQGELFHRYVLGVYQLQERLITEFPYLLLENCSGGGGRFDPGMLYYSPQIWCSDDTDAIERLKIQQGTALIYPLSTMGAHVSDCPNHGVGRITPFETRGHVALAGTFGYELDVTRIPKEDREMIPAQVAMYHRYNDLVREGDYYRIASYLFNNSWDAWEVVSKDKTEALMTVVEVLHQSNVKSRRVKFKGLDPERVYLIEETGLTLKGDSLMNAGINVGGFFGDFKSKLVHIAEVKG